MQATGLTKLPEVTPLQQPQLAQLAPQVFRHLLRARCDAREVARRVLRLQVAPALEGAPEPRLDQHQFRLEHELAAADPLPVDKRTYAPQSLPAQDLAPDHPIERTAVGELVGALRHHAGTVHMLARLTALAAFLQPLPDPVLKVLDR